MVNFSLGGVGGAKLEKSQNKPKTAQLHAGAGSWFSAVTELVEVFFGHSKMVADLVKDCRADLIDQIAFVSTGELDIFLENVNRVGESPVVFDASFGARAALIQAQQQVAWPVGAGAQAELFELGGRGAILNLNCHLL